MVSMSYSEKEFVTLIHEVTQLKPYAFYIVDSFGMMKQKVLMQLAELTEKNLLNDIILGFHAPSSIIAHDIQNVDAHKYYKGI